MRKSDIFGFLNPITHGFVMRYKLQLIEWKYWAAGIRGLISSF
jgi:hypothetical protein